MIRSPNPSLFTTSDANDVLPDTEATTIVPAPKTLPVTLNLAETVACDPNRKSVVVLLAKSKPPLAPPSSVKGELSVPQLIFPLASVVNF